MMSLGLWICTQMLVAADHGHPDHAKADVTSKDYAEARVWINRIAAPIHTTLKNLLIPTEVSNKLKELVTSLKGKEAASTAATVAPEEEEEEEESGIVDFIVYTLCACIFAWWYRGCEGKKSFSSAHLPEASPLMDETKPEWKHGLFACFDEPTLCCLSCCCPAVRWADTLDIANLHNFCCAFAVYMILWSLDYIGLPGTAILAGYCVAMRQNIRRLAGLPNGNCGTCFEDCLTYCFCWPCAIVQEARQLDSVYSGKMIVGDASSVSN